MIELAEVSRGGDVVQESATLTEVMTRRYCMRMGLRYRFGLTVTSFHSTLDSVVCDCGCSSSPPP